MLQATFRQLQIFTTVAQEGGFARAADRLCISQAGVSHHVRALERQLDCRLFERRTGAAAVLSRHGEALLRQAPALLERAAAIERLGSRSAAAETEVVRVGAGEHLLERLFRPALAGFQLQNPHVQAAFERIEQASQALSAVRRGRLDLAYFTVNRLGPDDPVEVLASIRVGLFAAPDQAARLSLGAGRGAALPLIMPLAGSAQERAIAALLRAGGVVDYEPVARAQYAETMTALAAVGVGVCCVFRESVAAELAEGRLVELAIELPRVFRCAARAPDAMARSHVRAFDGFAAALIRAGEGLP